MKGNKKIGITAEFVSITKAKDNPDYNNFVSNKSRILFNLLYFFMGKSLDSTFEYRLRLSHYFDKLINDENPKTIIELGAGFSLRGMEESKRRRYVEIDFPEIIEKKKRVLQKIYKNKRLVFPKNYIFIGKDLLKPYSVSLLGKSVFFAEGLVSYFKKEQFDIFVKNVYKAMNEKSVFIYHERWKRHKDLAYRFFRIFLSIISRSKSHLHFKSKIEAEDYFKKVGFSKIKIFEKEGITFIRLEK